MTGIRKDPVEDYWLDKGTYIEPRDNKAILLRGNLTFASALDLIIPAGTGSALEVTDPLGNDFLHIYTQLDTDLVCTWDFMAPPVSFASAAGSYAHTLLTEPRTITLTGGVTANAFDGIQLQLETPTVTSAVPTTIVRCSTLTVAAPVATGSLTITKNYAIYSGGSMRVDGNLDFINGASDLVAKANTQNALRITDGTTSLLAIDSRTATKGYIDIYGHLGIVTASIANAGLVYSETLTDPGNWSQGIRCLSKKAATSGNDAYQHVAINGAAYVAATNNKNLTNARGVVGIYGSANVDSGATGTVTGLVSGLFESDAAAMTATNRYGAYIANATGAGTVQTQIGLYIENMTKGSVANWSIYSVGGDAYFGGNIQAAGGVTFADAKYVTFTSPSASHTYSGFVKSCLCHEAMVFGDVCFINGDEEMVKANGAAIATMPAIAMAVASIDADASGLFLFWGFVHDDTFAFAHTGGAANKVYVSESTAGLATTTRPSGSSAVVQPIGDALATDILFLHPDNTYLELVA